MREYKIPVSWTMSGVIKVKANSAREALAALTGDNQCLRIPEQQHYVEDSFRVNCGKPEELN